MIIFDSKSCIVLKHHTKVAMHSKMTVSLLVLSVLVLLATANHPEDEGLDTHDQSLPLTIRPIVIPGTGEGACPSSEMRESARQNLTQEVRRLLRIQFDRTEVPECGEGQWLLVASLNMSDLTEQCPGDWLESAEPSRSCGRRQSAVESCNSAFFSSRDFEYNKVCGRMTGYSSGAPDAFGYRNGDPIYIDGVSITYGQSRNHIWSFAAGHNGRCPCDNEDRDFAPLPPDFVGDNYFCDTVETNGKLWDGLDCEDDCCLLNSPPWFNVTLPQATTESIEMRVCGDQDTGDENVLVEYIEVYVQ